MDKSEVYAKMCEKAFKDIGFIDQSQESYGSRLKNLYCCRSKFDKGKFVFLAQIEAPIKNWWQIYFQDQLQEMVAREFGESRELIFIFNKTIQDKYFDRFGTHEALWLAFAMKELYNKVWDGEGWVDKK